MEKKAIPVGIENFEDIIKDNYYYVDKSMLIEDILVNRAAVTLFTRPRRFGKTLNMSMIKYFFDVRNKDENRKLFEGLKIFGSEYMKEQGKYPVIFVSLKDLRGDTWEDTFENLKSFISDLYAEFEDMREIMNKRDKIKFDKIFYEEEKGDYETALKLLSNYIYKYYGKKVIILIDEYDAPIINAFDKGYYNEAINFFQVFYSLALKTNDSLKYGILTGITRIINSFISKNISIIPFFNFFNFIFHFKIIKHFNYFTFKKSKIL